MEIAATYMSVPELFGPTCHGAAGSFAYNFNRWLGAVGEISGCKGSGPSGIPIFGGSATETTRTWFSYLAGARVSYRRRVTPYAHILLGGAHADTDYALSAIRGDAFAMAIGIGVDVRVSKHVGIRIIQPEYLRTDFGNFSRVDLRLQTGVVFGFGK